eukprot:symbB.v1.2.022604.t4/scaffold2000.1/size92914/3
MPVGAGAAKARPPKPPLSSPGSSPALQLRGRNVASQEASSVQESTHGAWAPQTVEIQGADGEVLGLRPCGEVLALKPKDTARMAMPSLEEVLLPREVKTVRPMAKRRSESKELRPGTPKDRHSAEAAVASEASIPSTGETNQEKQLPEALAAAVAHLMDVANCVAAAARKTDPTPDSDGHAPKPTKPPMSPSSRASQGKLRPWSKANGSARSIEAELRTPDRLAARRSRSAVPGEKALRGPTEDVPGRSPGRVSRVKSSSESPGACNRSKLMGKYADLDHVLLLPPDAIHWSSSAVEDTVPPDAASAWTARGQRWKPSENMRFYGCSPPFQDMFGEGFPLFAEIQTGSEALFSIFARTCAQDEPLTPTEQPSETVQIQGQSIQVERTSDMVLRHDLVSALEAGLEAPAPATAAYFALAWKMKFQVPLFVLWCHEDCLTASGSSARPPEQLKCTASSFTVNIFIFKLPQAKPSPPGSLILAPTGSGKSTWRSLAPIYCPESEVLADVTFHPSYHKSIRLGAGGWLSSEAVELFLRDLAILMRWLHGQSGQAKITFNCSGEVLMKAVELKILRPEAT